MKKRAALCGALVGLVMGVCEAWSQDLVSVDSLPVVTGGAEITKFHPSSDYAKLWYEVEDCLEMYRDMRKVKFYAQVANEFNAIQCDGGTCFGRYDPREDALYFSDTLLRSVILLKHEFMHALGIHGHPPEVFYRCADWTYRSTPHDGEWL